MRIEPRSTALASARFVVLALSPGCRSRAVEPVMPAPAAPQSYRRVIAHVRALHTAGIVAAVGPVARVDGGLSRVPLVDVAVALLNAQAVPFDGSVAAGHTRLRLRAGMAVDPTTVPARRYRVVLRASEAPTVGVDGPAALPWPTA